MAASEVIYQLRREVLEKDLLIEKMRQEIKVLQEDVDRLNNTLDKKVNKSSKVNF